jgi:hypothetical protein
MAKSEFRVRMEGPVSIVEVRGDLDAAAAENLLEFTAAARRDGRRPPVRHDSEGGLPAVRLCLPVVSVD